MKIPEKVDFTPEEANALFKRIEKNELTPNDQNLLKKIVNFNFWMQNKLTEAQLSMKRLRAIFGVKTEKKRI